MSTVKKQQHFVWKHYLKPWTKNDKICCSGHGNIFHTSLDNIAQKRFFYKSEPLNSHEFSFVQSFIEHLHPSAKTSQFGLLRMYCITANYDDYLQKCGIEDFHGIVESKFKSVLAKIYGKDLSFFENDEGKNNFSFYVGCQYTRTNKMRTNLENAPLKIPESIDKEKIAKVLSLLMGDMIGNWMFSKSKLTLLINDTDENLITGDQPIINTKALNSNKYNPPKEIELCFPITPKIAIYLSDKSMGEQKLNVKEVKEFNEMIIQQSKEQIYSMDKSDLTAKS